MRFKRSAFHAVAGAALVVAMGVASPARAAFIAYICNDVACTGGDDTIVTDQGTGDNYPGSASFGQINAGTINIAGFVIATNVAQSKPLIGSASSPSIDLDFTATTNDSQSHTLYLYASDTGFTGPGTFAFTLGGTQLPAGARNGATGSVLGGSSNNNLDRSQLLASLSSGNTPYALQTTFALTPSVNPYSLTVGVVITRAVAGTTTGDANLAFLPLLAVPEPTTALLLALGLVGVCVQDRRARARQTFASRA